MDKPNPGRRAGDILDSKTRKALDSYCSEHEPELGIVVRDGAEKGKVLVVVSATDDYYLAKVRVEAEIPDAKVFRFEDWKSGALDSQYPQNVQGVHFARNHYQAPKDVDVEITATEDYLKACRFLMKLVLQWALIAAAIGIVASKKNDWFDKAVSATAVVGLFYFVTKKQLGDLLLGPIIEWSKRHLYVVNKLADLEARLGGDDTRAKPFVKDCRL